MKVDDYMQVGGADLEPAVKPLAELIGRHARSVFTQDVLGREPQFLDRALLERRAQILAQPVFARQDAKARKQTYPLILGHPGLGAGFADNFVLYELLASHGYLVISSAFQSAETNALNISWEPATSIADLDAIVSWARRNLRIGAVATLGYSYGAGGLELCDGAPAH